MKAQYIATRQQRLPKFPLMARIYVSFMNEKRRRRFHPKLYPIPALKEKEISFAFFSLIRCPQPLQRNAQLLTT